MDAGPDLSASVERLPLGPLREPLVAAGAFLVGGAVRDLLGGRGLGPDLDVAIDGDVDEVLASLDPELTVEIGARHARFGTATVHVGDIAVDLSRTRSETYAASGALPDVSPASIEPDLARRDFTVNAMAIRLGAGASTGAGRLLDPFGGRADLRSGTLRVLHERSFIDDPTRAIRAARYASRLGLDPDPDTLARLRAANLATVSDDRRRAELARLAGEPTAAAGFELLEEWGLLALPSGAAALIGAVCEVAAGEPWGGWEGVRERAILLAVAGGERVEAASRLAAAAPERPSEAVRLAAAHPPEELLLAQADGGGWVADYLGEWRSMRLEIDGTDLIAAGIPEGPAIGAALRGALERKLDGGLVGGREAELELALELARAAL